MNIVLVIGFYTGHRCDGFDTFYLDESGRYSGAFLNRKPFHESIF